MVSWRAIVFSVAVAAFSALAPGAVAGSSPVTLRTVDTGLCPFPLDVTVKGPASGTTVLKFEFAGPRTVTLRNAKTGRTVTLASPGSYSVSKTGSVTFTGRQVWFWWELKHVPFLSTTGNGKLAAPLYSLTGATHATVIDPCALVAAATPSTKPAATPAPWPRPAYALSHIAYAGLTPVLGVLRRHDHVHLDVIVNGRKVTIPPGVGMAEPKDGGPCPPHSPNGDCATGHIWGAQVANSPLHTHSTSGIIHIESDRRETFTLGQFFDEWGVRFDSSCLGSYCTGGGMELRVYVNGKRVTGDPRRVVLTNRQEIAVDYGSSFGAAPSTYAGGWPGSGCGGPGDPACLPPGD